MQKFSNIINTAEKLGMTVKPNEVLKNYTTFKVGGTCDVLIEMDTAEHTVELIKCCMAENIKYYIIGKGSNLLIDDAGISGVVFNMGKDFADIKIERNILTCEAGASLAKICKEALNNSLTGLEFAYGIPGSVGGAVYMNAGAYGGEIADVIKSCKAVGKDGVLRIFSKEEMELGYRKSIFCSNEYVILEVDFELKSGEQSEIKARMDELMEKRISKQPMEHPSAGSTFKRPDGSYASLLIEQCGLKGMSVGDAEVSTKHSGFIVNKGNASFDDILTLISKVQDEVRNKTGYSLECEPLILTDREVF